jgi:hypothetical protein
MVKNPPVRTAAGSFGKEIEEPVMVKLMIYFRRGPTQRKLLLYLPTR